MSRYFGSKTLLFLFALPSVSIFLLAILASTIAPFDPGHINPIARLQPIGSDYLFGTDALGRDIFSRTLYGAQISLGVGAGVTVLAITLGLIFGILAGYMRLADMIIMRVMDGIMSIPGIVLAIAFVAVWGGGFMVLVVAIAIPEFPRIVRVVRAVILSLRSEAYIEAAQILGTRPSMIMWRHLLPNTVAPLLVQGSFIFSSAILIEASLSFLGVGLPPEMPSWGNIMAEGRQYFQIAPGMIFMPGLFLAATVLSINMVGDVLRDALDPKLARRM